MTSVDDVYEANTLVGLRTAYIAEKAKLATISVQTIILEQTELGLANDLFEILTGAAPGTADADGFDAVKTAIDTYIDAKIAEVETQLTALGVTY